MPHSTLPYMGFQAVILCGPGASLDTFTSNPKEFPKALLPVANRPMVWYPLDWCYRMGVTDITLITPPESAQAIESALAQNPHLTSLPSPKPVVLAPADLTQVTGTGAIFRLPEVVDAIKSDFVVLPCDLICELDGTALMQTWMTLEAGLGEASGCIRDGTDVSMLGGEKSGRRGGLGLWYPTKGLEGISTKAEQTDFIATIPLPRTSPPPPPRSIQQHVKQLVLSAPMTTVKDTVDDNGALPIRHALLKQHGALSLQTTHRDAHVYFLPHWALGMMRATDFDSVAEDVIGWWAKATWQPGLADKLGLHEVLGQGKPASPDADELMTSSARFDDDVDVLAMSTTGRGAGAEFAVPPFLAYVQPPHPASVEPAKAPQKQPQQPLIRRADTSALLLSLSLRLARLDAPHPLAQAHVDPSAMLAPQSRVGEDSLVGANAQVAGRVNVKESVVGTNCVLGAGARVTRCLLMEGAVVGEGATLVGCILGRRAAVGKGARLTDCEVAGGCAVEREVEAKGEKFMGDLGMGPGSDEELYD